MITKLEATQKELFYEKLFLDLPEEILLVTPETLVVPGVPAAKDIK
ncbi:hypothetical protein AB1A81_15415 [Bdellovibrio bacteriovorus]|uniref:Uncharacterized protein n=1 Tax=Bdellovibrio bacteriovorus (strain ATCC 15356 / DSM 50701 / NCIMB 9529 / HD100) TaxID=264462 RepID=Q6MI17_BDEBA|nr:hypothetical protein [Bdellovibrio bacteriovorus]CAE78165.1 hypothetical protein predicted by Glimmer/Critica [Bdellovibrio bacteriovorus HD100]